MVRKIILALVAVVVAMAASAPLKADDKKPPARSGWEGFYIGGNFGYGRSRATMSESDTIWYPVPQGPAFFKPTTLHEGASGALGGLHLGYNWQVTPRFLLGVEGDWTWANLNAGNTVGPVIEYDGTVAVGSTVTMSTQVKSFGSLRGRLGFTEPNWMAYVTGGPALAQLQFDGDLFCPVGICIGSDTHAPVSVTKNRFGWVAGGGLEFKGATSPWVFGVEYLYYRFSGTENVDASLVRTSTGAPVAVGFCTVSMKCFHYAFGDVDVQTVRVRLSYKFGGLFSR